MGLCNYLAAALFYGLWIAREGLWTCDWRTVAIGAIGGAFYGGGFFLILAPMRWRGVGIVSAILGLSVLLPVLFSFVLWRETLAPVQVAGVALALCALPLLGFDEGARGGRLTLGMAAVMLGLFLVNGGCMTVQKWFHTTGLEGRGVFFCTCSRGGRDRLRRLAWRGAEAGELTEWAMGCAGLVQCAGEPGVTRGAGSAAGCGCVP